MSVDIPAAPGDFQSRRLCPDGSCLGVIGPDGRCTVCGRVVGPSSDKGSVREAAQSESVDEPVGADDPLSLPAAEAEAGDGFDPGRRLCPDGACLGLIGPNGRCNICGRLADDIKK
ncbi:MAG: hypothetical protein J7M25_03305 [Deltaproteobacteria bacterium]|nr:hypothetical protein [Deltaproteobacteria bacterium]